MRWRLATAILAALLTAAAVPALRHLRETPPPPPPALRAALDAPVGSELGSGDDILDAAISPDGLQIAFVATADGVPALWQRALDSDRAQPLRGTEGASLPAWKQDGSALSFFSGGQLRTISLADGRVSDLAPAALPSGAAWLSDGSLLFADGTGPIRRLARGAAGNATALKAGDTTHRFPVPVGTSGDFLYVAHVASGRPVVRLVSGGRETDLVRTSGHAVMFGDVLLHVIDGTLSAQRIDRERGAPVGRSTPLAFDVGLSPAGHAFFTASNRVVAWAAAASRARELRWFAIDGTRGASVADPADIWQVRLSPDDRLAAVTMVEPLLRTLDIFVVPAAAAAASARRVSLSLSADTDPVWSPGGERIVFRSMQNGQPTLLARPPQFSEQADQTVLRSDLDETASDWRDDAPGPALLFHAPGSGTGLDIWALDVGSGARRPVARGAFNESDARWSPDGRWIAYVSDESGQPEVVVERWPPDGRRRRVTTAGGSRPRWRRDGRALFFLRGGRLMQAAALDGSSGSGGSTDTSGSVEADLQVRLGDLIFGTATPIADWPDVRDYDAAHHSDRLLAIVAAPRTRAARAGIIVDWPSILPASTVSRTSPR